VIGFSFPNVAKVKESSAGIWLSLSTPSHASNEDLFKKVEKFKGEIDPLFHSGYLTHIPCVSTLPLNWTGTGKKKHWKTTILLSITMCSTTLLDIWLSLSGMKPIQFEEKRRSEKQLVLPCSCCHHQCIAHHQKGKRRDRKKREQFTTAFTDRSSVRILLGNDAQGRQMEENDKWSSSSSELL
jgi:hypothetical protein